MTRHLMKTQEAADYLGIHKHTLHNWIKQNRKITYTRDPVTGFRYFEKADLDKYMDGMKVNAKV